MYAWLNLDGAPDGWLGSAALSYQSIRGLTHRRPVFWSITLHMQGASRYDCMYQGKGDLTTLENEPMAKESPNRQSARQAKPHQVPALQPKACMDVKAQHCAAARYLKCITFKTNECVALMPGRRCEQGDVWQEHNSTARNRYMQSPFTWHPGSWAFPLSV